MKVKYFIDVDKAKTKDAERHERLSLRITDVGGYDPLHPVVHHEGDAGIDLFAPDFETVPGHGMRVIDTFVAFEMPTGTVGLVWPRGGDEHLIGSGVIDEGYRGTIKVRVFNPHPYPIAFEKGDSLGQLVILNKFCTDNIELEQSLDPFDKNTERGDSGRINN